MVSVERNEKLFAIACASFFFPSFSFCFSVNPLFSQVIYEADSVIKFTILLYRFHCIGKTMRRALPFHCRDEAKQSLTH